MPDLDEFMLAKLARELAMQIRPYKAIFEDFGIDETDFYQIEKIEFFKRAKEQFTLEWNSSLSAAERVKVISAAYLEQVLPVIGAKAINAQENLGAQTDVAKFFAKNAGIGETGPDAKSAAERFVIHIDLGGDIEKYDRSVLIDANDVDANQKPLPRLASPNQALPSHATPSQALPGSAELQQTNTGEPNGQITSEIPQENVVDFFAPPKE